jgi:hypothetical protein
MKISCTSYFLHSSSREQEKLQLSFYRVGHGGLLRKLRVRPPARIPRLTIEACGQG